MMALMLKNRNTPSEKTTCMIDMVGERPLFFGALFPVMMPQKLYGAVHYSASLAGIKTGDRAEKHRSVPERDVPEQGVSIVFPATSLSKRGLHTII